MAHSASYLLLKFKINQSMFEVEVILPYSNNNLFHSVSILNQMFQVKGY